MTCSTSCSRRIGSARCSRAMGRSLEHPSRWSARFSCRRRRWCDRPARYRASTPTWSSCSRMPMARRSAWGLLYRPPTSRRAAADRAHREAHRPHDPPERHRAAVPKPCRLLLRSADCMTNKLARNATTVLFICTLAISACGGGAGGPSPEPSAGPAARVETAPTPTPTPAPTATPAPTPSPKPKIWPLTGLPATGDAPTGRRPLNVLLPNDPNARPQYGLTKADIVFELIVEGGVTRFSAIYHSRDVDTI